MTRRLIIAAMFVMAMLCPLGRAQTSFYSDRALQQVNVLTSPTPLTAAIPYGGVRVCSLPLTQQQPCLPLATITDINGNPVSNSIGPLFGQLTTDATGRFTFGCTLGLNYQVQVAASASNTPAVNYPITCPGVGSGPQFNGNVTVTPPGSLSVSGTTTLDNTNKTINWDGSTAYPYTSVGLQAAINAACNGTIQGRVVLAAFGTFSISGVTIPSLCTIEGMGQGQTILQLPSSSATNATVLSNSTPSTGNTGIYLHDFTVDGNKAGQTNVGQVGISLTKVANSTLFHIECKNTIGNSASCVQWLTTSGGANTEDHDNTVEFCYFHDNGTSTTNNADGLAIGGVRVRIVGLISTNNTDSGVGLQGGTDFAILNGIYQGNSLTGVAFGAISSSQGGNSRVTIENNVFLSNGASIVSDRANDVVITGNMMKTTTGTGNKEHILLVSTQGASIVGNRIFGSLSNGITVNDILATDLTNHLSITGNTIEFNNQAGIRINVTNVGALVKNVTISGNTIMNNSQSPTNSIDGLNVSSSAASSIIGMAIEGNILSDDQGVATQRYGIAMQSGANAPINVLVGHNQAIGNATGSFINLPTDANSVSVLGTTQVPYADNLIQEGTITNSYKQVWSYFKGWRETTAPTASANNDVCYGDSTLHALKCAYNNGTFFQIPQVISATSAAFATATTAGTCVQNTTAVAGAATTMAVSVSPVSTPGVGAVWSAFVSSAGNVTINECAVATSAGGTIAFNIRVTP